MPFSWINKTASAHPKEGDGPNGAEQLTPRMQKIEAFNKKFQQNLDELTAFMKEHDGKIPDTIYLNQLQKEGKVSKNEMERLKLLRSFMSAMRTAYRSRKLSQSKAEQLVAIGIDLGDPNKRDARGRKKRKYDDDRNEEKEEDGEEEVESENGRRSKVGKSNISNNEPVERKEESKMADQLPVHHHQVAARLQELDDDEFNIWMYEVEAERRRRLDEQVAKNFPEIRRRQRLEQEDQERLVTTQLLAIREQEPTVGKTAENSTNQLLQANDDNLNGLPTTLDEKQKNEDLSSDTKMGDDANMSLARNTSSNEEDGTGTEPKARTICASLNGSTAPETNKKKSSRPGPPSKRDLRWELMFLNLIDYKVKHGNCEVPHNFGTLYSWASAQRRRYRRGDISPGQQRKLSNLGFSLEKKNWEREAIWEKRIGQLREFRTEFGHVRVPQHYKGHGNLGLWVKTMRQRRQREQSGKTKFLDARGRNYTILSEERVQQLNDLGFEWHVLTGRGKKNQPSQNNMLEYDFD